MPDNANTPPAGVTFGNAVSQDTPVTRTQAPPQPPPQGVTFGDAVTQDTPADKVQRGEQINDVGNTVIVPKEGETFADTMKRAAAQGKKTTPEQIQAEVNTMPGKAATVLAAAPAIGAAGVSAPLAPEMLGVAKNAILKHLAEQSPELFGHEAVKETLKKYAMQGLQKSLTGAAWAGGAEILHSIWDDVFGKKK